MDTLIDKIKEFLKINKEDSIYNDYSANGNGYGNGYGSGRALGWGSLYGVCICAPREHSNSREGIVELNDQDVFSINDIPVHIKAIRNSTANVLMILEDFSTVEKYVYKIGNVIAFGDSVSEAAKNAKAMAIRNECHNCSPNFVNYVLSRYPDVNAKYPVTDLLELHNVITGSCVSGRTQYIRDNKIDLNGEISMKAFLISVRNLYGGDSIDKIIKAYGILKFE